MKKRSHNSPNISTCLVYTGVEGGGGGEHSIIWPRGVCTAEQGMVFRYWGHSISLLGLGQGVFFGSEAFKRVWMELTMSSLYLWCQQFFPSKSSNSMILV